MIIHQPPIQSYTILVDYSTNGLTAQVNTFISNGWQPLGGLSVVQVEGQGTEYSQPMVKYQFTHEWATTK